MLICWCIITVFSYFNAYTACTCVHKIMICLTIEKVAKEEISAKSVTNAEAGQTFVFYLNFGNYEYSLVFTRTEPTCGKKMLSLFLLSYRNESECVAGGKGILCR